MSWLCEIRAFRTVPSYALCALLGAACAFGQGGSLHLKGGTVYTITGSILKDADVVIEKGVITAVGHGLATPRGGKVIDCRGKVLLPGLVLAEELLYLGRPPNNVDVFDVDFYFVLGSGITAVPAGSYIMKLTAGNPKGLILARRNVRSLSLRSWVSRYRLRQGLLKARQFLRTAEKQKTGSGARPPAEAAAYLPLLQKKVTAWCSAHRAQDILAACALAREFDFPLVVTGAVEAWAVAEEIGRAHASVVFSVRRLTGPRPDPDSPPGSNVRAPAILRDAGVRFALVPPSGGVAVTGGIAGRGATSLIMEAAFAVRGGLDEATALEAISIEPARILGVAHRIGSLEKGKDGDVVVLSGPPLDFKTVVELTVINGTVYYDRSKTELLPGGPPRKPKK